MLSVGDNITLMFKLRDYSGLGIAIVVISSAFENMTKLFRRKTWVSEIRFWIRQTPALLALCEEGAART
jgi:hypothetical protein